MKTKKNQEKIEAKIFFKKLLVFAPIFLAVFFLYFLPIIKFSNTPNMTFWEKEVYALKDKIASSKQTPKIIILGGSGSLFSISAKQIEESLKIPTVNYATYAGLKTYILERAKRISNSGDTIILVLEYE